jgi:hypothetical protein
MLLPWFYHWPLYNMCTGVNSTTSVSWYWVFLDQWYRQEGCAAHYEQVVNNVVSSFVDNLFIVGSTTLFTPVNVNWEQVIDFLYFYVCIPLFFLLFIILYSIYHIGCRSSKYFCHHNLVCLSTVTHGLGKKYFDQCRGWVNKITVFFASLRYQPQV